MPTLLAVAALALAALFVVQVVRGRLRPTCCAPPADRDARLRTDADQGGEGNR